MASPSRASRRAGRMEDPVTKQVGGFRPARNRAVQEVLHPHHAAGREFRDLHQVHAVLAATARTRLSTSRPDGIYDANMEACCGCGVCEAVCPVDNCVTMVNETEFHDNASQWEAFKKDKDAYLKWLEATIKKAEPIRSGRTASVIAASTGTGTRGPGNR